MERTPLRSNKQAEVTDLTDSILFVETDNAHPHTNNWTNFVVVLPAFVTGLDGTVYGLLLGRTAVSSTGKTRRSDETGWSCKQLIDGVTTGPPFSIKKSEAYFPSRQRYETNVDALLFRFGRTYLNGEAAYFQCHDITITALGGNKGNSYALLATERGNTNGAVSVKTLEFETVTQMEYLLNYGHGTKKNKKAQLTRYGLALDTVAGQATCLQELRPSDKAPPVMIEGHGIMTVLDEHGDEVDIDVGPHLTEYLFAPTRRVTFDPTGSTGHAPAVMKQAVNKPVQPVKTKLNFEGLLGDLPALDTEDDNSDDELESTMARDLGVESSAVGRAMTAHSSQRDPYSKNGVNLTERQKEVSKRIIDEGRLYRGKWKQLNWDSKAGLLLHLERMRAEYNVTNTTTIQVLTGSMGETSLSFMLPTDLVPMGAEENISSAKWNSSDTPKKWITSMDSLVAALRVIDGIGQEYYRADVSRAIHRLYANAFDWVTLVLPQAGVNAYRDLYSGALVQMMDAAASGTTGRELENIVDRALHPSSAHYSHTITDRISRLDAGRAWGKTSYKAETVKTTVDEEKPDTTPKKPKTMSPEQRALLPRNPAGLLVCLAFQTERGCRRRETCGFEHEVIDVPVGLRQYTKNKHGKLTTRQN